MPPITIKGLFRQYESVGLRFRVEGPLIEGSWRFAAEGRHDW
jgi:hypothetical protein